MVNCLICMVNLIVLRRVRHWEHICFHLIIRLALCDADADVHLLGAPGTMRHMRLRWILVLFLRLAIDSHLLVVIRRIRLVEAEIQNVLL